MRIFDNHKMKNRADAVNSICSIFRYQDDFEELLYVV